MELKVKLVGRGPMLMHNGRMANPLCSYVREMKPLTGKRNKTDEDHAKLMQIEARGACWETEKGEMGVPNAAVWATIYNAAKAFKRGEDIKRALLYEDVVEPMVVKGQSVACDEYLFGNEQSVTEHIDYRPVRVKAARPMRARPKVEGWESEHTFELLTDVVNERDLEPILERAGRLVGIGDWRPIYGKFTAEVVN